MTASTGRIGSLWGANYHVVDDIVGNVTIREVEWKRDALQPSRDGS